MTATGTDVAPDRPPLRVVVLADDLIWSSRLVEAARRAGGSPEAVRSASTFAHAVEAATGLVIVDLGGRAYDGIAEIRRAVAAGRAVIAVAQHDDVALRRRALAAGARRVFSYNKLFSDGPRVVEQLLAGEL